MGELFQPCALVPTYDNPATIGAMVEGIHKWLADVVVVDDGSGPVGRQAIQALASSQGVHIHRREENGGKGAAVKDGFRVAQRLGFSHVLQVDADGQHRLEDIPRFLEAARSSPNALILGYPQFDSSAPRSRVMGRRITWFWTNLETYGKRIIRDAMCGIRVYPLDQAIRAAARGNAMDFDPEIVVRMVWQEVPVVNLPTRVRYIAPEDGGVSHFRLVRDNALISWMHTRLVVGAILRLIAPS